MNFNNSNFSDDEENSEPLQSRLQDQINLSADSNNSNDSENSENQINQQPQYQQKQNSIQSDDEDEEEEYDQVNQLEQPQSDENNQSDESYEEEDEPIMESKIPPSRFQKRQAIQRPQTATIGTRKPQVLTQSNVMLSQKNNNNMQKSQLQPKRPQTSYNNKENQLTQSSTTFRPIYTQSFQTYNMQNKKFNYAQKKFKTVTKRSDPVAKFQSFNNSWKKTKFLQSNSTKGKEGRKLNLSERIQSSKPEEIFYRYLPKYAYF